MLFTLDEVLAAYDKTQFKPIHGVFLTSDKTCACPLSTVYAAKTSNEEVIQLIHGESGINEDIMFEKFAELFFPESTLELEEKCHAMQNFYMGFDHYPNNNPLFKQDEAFGSYYWFGAEIRKELNERLGVR